MSFAIKPRLGLLCFTCQYRTYSTNTYRQLAEQAAKTNANATATPTPTTPKPVASTRTTPPRTAPTRTTPTKTTATATTTPTTATTTAPPDSDPSSKPVPPSSPLKDAPRSWGQRVREFTPQPLSRPIGLTYPPKPGQNTGIDLRTFRQRREDLLSREKHLKRREEMKERFSRPYFRDITNLALHKGKTFVSPPRLFKDSLSLYFPNLYGRTLLKTDTSPRDTTPTLKGKVSVVAIFSGMWAENQAKTFISPESNPELARVLDESRDAAQLVRINFEPETLKALMIRLFMGSIRRRIGEPNWHRYFIVRKGITDDIRESIGLLNAKVGYVYLLDADCRIRWAGCGPSEDHERRGLVKGLEKLVRDHRRDIPTSKA
ncbi:ATP10 protein-domain-containing protein [Biscogniauxia mediterranea]|nr:ATP10 protein-domain-containing protein [Biscogniauxia mediterranea]